MKRWNTEEIELLYFLIENNFSYKEISLELDRTLPAIRNKCTELNILSKKKEKPIRNKSTEQYKSELRKINPLLVVLEEYINNKTPILHKCLGCGTVKKSYPKDKLRGDGCNICSHKNNRGNLLNKSSIVYIIYIPKYTLYKIGCTNKTTEERMKDLGLGMRSYEIILERHFETGNEAMKLEKEWLANIEQYKINTGLLKTGNTETFKLPL
jgi:hypothetical protein